MTGAPDAGGRRRGRDGGAHAAHRRSRRDRPRGRAATSSSIREGCEAAAGEVILRAGTRLDYSGVALLAAVGRTARAGLPQADSGDHRDGRRDRRAAREPRRSSRFATRMRGRWRRRWRARAGSRACCRSRATRSSTRARSSSRGSRADLLLLSGGVSAGKHDVVEPVLAALGAEFFFDRVLIQPGQPLVFGRARERSFSDCRGIPRRPW